jgi:hypothetical protein
MLFWEKCDSMANKQLRRAQRKNAVVKLTMDIFISISTFAVG